MEITRNTAAYKNYRFMTGFLHIAHNHKLHKVSNVKAVGSGVESDIKRHALASQKFVKLFFSHRLA